MQQAETLKEQTDTLNSSEIKEMEAFLKHPEQLSAVGAALEESTPEIRQEFAGLIPSELIPELDEHFVRTMRGIQDQEEAFLS